MKVVIVLFSVLFVIMFYTGYKSGEAFVNSPHFLETYAFSKIQIHKINDTYQFSYGPKENILYWFDVDKNKLHKASIEALILENSDNLSIPSSFILTDPSIPAALGGATFGFSVKDIIGNPKKVIKSLKNNKTSHWRQLLAGALGMASGYSAGYWVATRGKLPKFDDPKLIDIVKDEKKWVAWEISILVNIYSKLEDMSNRITNLEQKKFYEDLLFVVAGTAVNRSDKGDLISKDLENLAKVDEFIRSEYENELEEEDFIEKLLFYYLPWTLFLIFVGVLIFIGVTSLLELRKKTKQEN